MSGSSVSNNQRPRVLIYPMSTVPVPASKTKYSQTSTQSLIWEFVIRLVRYDIHDIWMWCRSTMHAFGLIMPNDPDSCNSWYIGSFRFVPYIMYVMLKVCEEIDIFRLPFISPSKSGLIFVSGVSPVVIDTSRHNRQIVDILLCCTIYHEASHPTNPYIPAFSMEDNLNRQSVAKARRFRRIL